jgi:copper(I)-binding protein
MFKKFVAFFALLVFAFALSGCSPVQGPETHSTGMVIESAWITSTDKAGNSYVYAKITNRLNATVSLVGGSTDDGDTAVVSRNEIDADQILKDGAEIHVGQTLELTQTGKRLYITNQSKPIGPGDKVLFTFHFKGAQAQTIILTAK